MKHAARSERDVCVRAGIAMISERPVNLGGGTTPVKQNLRMSPPLQMEGPALAGPSGKTGT